MGLPGGLRNLVLWAAIEHQGCGGVERAAVTDADVDRIHVRPRAEHGPDRLPVVDVHVVGDRLGVGGTVFFAGAAGYIWTGR